MKIRKLPKLIFLLITFISANFSLTAQTDYKNVSSSIHFVGSMKNVMWGGQLYGITALDTISNRQHLYGLGPVEYLTGELLIVDGKSYKSSVLTDTTMQVENTYTAKAPFFAYTNVGTWKKQTLPDSIQTIQQLENYLDQITKKAKRPFIFKLTGTVKKADIHIVNLPKGIKVNSPEDAHKGQINYSLLNVQSEIIGFFSTEHQSIFMHHDTYLHMHLITTDLTKMGHLDDVLFKVGSMKLYLPSE